jgi:hypothetical protein
MLDAARVGQIVSLNLALLGCPEPGDVDRAQVALLTCENFHNTSEYVKGYIAPRDSRDNGQMAAFRRVSRVSC